MPKGCALRILIVFLVVAGALVWYAVSASNRLAEEQRRCDEEATSAIAASNDRMSKLQETTQEFEAGKLEIETTLRTIQDIRSSGSGIISVLTGEVDAGRCRLEHRPVIRLLELEEKAGTGGADYVSFLIRADQAQREVDAASKEAKDYLARYRRLKQAHLLRTAREFSAQARSSRHKAQTLKDQAAKSRDEYEAASSEHEDIARKIG